MQRPFGVTLTTVLLAVSVLITLPVYLAGPLANHVSIDSGLMAYTFHAIFITVAGLVLIGGIASALWFYFHGHPWARVALGVLCVACFIPVYRLVHSSVSSSHGRVFIFIFRAVSAALTLLSMMTPSSRLWFASEPDAYEDPKAG
jgi:hypothetical protein